MSSGGKLWRGKSRALVGYHFSSESDRCVSVLAMWKLRVYVAGASAEIERAERAIELCKAAGFVVVSTWPNVVRTVGNANPREASKADRRRWSVADLEEVDRSDVLWQLTPTKPITTSGAWVELGCAYRAGKYIIASGDTKQSIFPALGEEFATDDEVIDYLRTYETLIRRRLGRHDG